MDTYTEVTHEGCLTRLWSSIKGVFIGFLLFALAFPLLFWNEGRAVQTAKSLEEGLGAVTEVEIESVDPGNDGDLVYATGMTSAEGVLVDPVFGASSPGIMLRRKVEMYQWKETRKTKEKKKVGGGKEKKTTYTYDKVWSSTLIKSSGFKKTAGHENPSAMAYESESWKPLGGVKLGAFEVPFGVVDDITNRETIQPPGFAGFTANGSTLYSGNAGSPTIGDLRISWEVTHPTRISIVAGQTGNTFAPWQAEAGDEIMLVEEGEVAASKMFQNAQDANSMLTWILRLVGWLVMAIGIGMFFQPFVVMADVIPFIGSFLSAGIAIFAGLVALPLSLVTIAVAWIFYRPLLAAALIGGAVVILVGVYAFGRWRKGRRAAA